MKKRSLEERAMSRKDRKQRAETRMIAHDFAIFILYICLPALCFFLFGLGGWRIELNGERGECVL